MFIKLWKMHTICCIKFEFGLLIVGQWPLRLNKMKMSFIMTGKLICAAFLHNSYGQESFQLSFQKSFLVQFLNCQHFPSAIWRSWTSSTLNIPMSGTIAPSRASLTSDNIDCIQFSSERCINSWKICFFVLILFGSGNNQHITITTFQHRTWNHFCRTYASKFGGRFN